MSHDYNTGPRNMGFEQWTERAKLELEYLEKIGELRLNLARASNIDAHTGQQYATTQAKELGIQESTQLLQRMKQRRRTMEQEAEGFKTMGKHLSYFRLGENAGRLLRLDMWAAWMKLLRFAPGDVLDTWANTPTSLDESQLVGKTGVDTPCDIPHPPSYAMNLIQTMQWLYSYRNNCVIRVGSLIWQEVNRGIELAATSQAAAIAALKYEIGQIETGAYSRIPPLDLIRLTMPSAAI